jgi:hypothetical protein
VSKPAFANARQQLLEKAFRWLHERLVDEGDPAKPAVPWNGSRLGGLEGSTVQLPESDELRQEVGGVAHQDGPGMARAKISMAHA